MKNIYLFLLVSLMISITSCDVDEVLNPNSPTVESFESGATLADLKLLGQGLQAVMRDDVQFHFWTLSILGREYFDLRGTDPRYTSELLGQNGGSLDNNGFLTTRTYFGRFRTVRNAELLKTAIQNTVATLTDAERNGAIGFANTVAAYEMLLEATRQYENGIRLDVADPNNLGPFTGSFQESLTGIKQLLDEGHGQLSSSSGDFIFVLAPDAFGSIPGSAVEKVAQFNRAIAARIELYRGNTNAALTELNSSFMDLGGGMDIGAYYAYGGATGNDAANPFFFVPGVDNYMVHPSWVADATEGDLRLSKGTQQDLIELDGLSGDHLVTIYDSNMSPASIIRNEELILIYAESQVGSNTDEAVRGINLVRNAAGLNDYSGATDNASLIDEILYQRRYSLFGEGHRWIDLRRYDRLGEIPIDRAGDQVHVQFPRPANEG